MAGQGQRADLIPAIFGFALATAYCPWITGAAATPRWCVLVALVLWALIFLPRTRWQAAPVAWGAVFVAWALGSLLWSDALEGRDLAWKLALYAALFMAGGQMASLRQFYCGAALGLAVSSVLVIADLAGFISYPQVTRPSGLFVNGLYLAEFAAMIMAPALMAPGMPLWAYFAVAPSILLVDMARGPVLAFIVAALWQPMTQTYRTLAVGMLIFAVGIVALAALRPSTVLDRLDVWGDLIRQLTLLGHGLGAYFGDAPGFSVLVEASYQRKLHANNDLLEIAYDLGTVGVISAVGFIWSVMRGPLTAERLVILVFIVEGMFGFPSYLPWSAGLFCLCAGHVCRSGDLRVRSPGSRRISIFDGNVGEVCPVVTRSSDGGRAGLPMGVQIPHGTGGTAL